MKGIKISSRYARSLVELCREKGQTDTVLKDMALVHATIRGSRELSVMLNSPVVKADAKVEVLGKVFGGAVGDVTLGFIKLLTQKGREGYLEEVAESFVDQVRADRNIVVAQVTTATTLDSESRDRISTLAKKLAGGEIELTEKVDAEVIGGFVLRVGDKMIDTSVLNSLRNMKRNFDDNPYVAEL